MQMQLWGPPPGGVTVTPDLGSQGLCQYHCGFQGQSVSDIANAASSVLEVEHRGSTCLRTPEPCDAKGTPNRKEAAQTDQAQIETGGLDSRQPRVRVRTQCLSQKPLLIPAGAITELRGHRQRREEEASLAPRWDTEASSSA